MRGLHLGQAVEEEAVLEGALDKLPGISRGHVQEVIGDLYAV